MMTYFHNHWQQELYYRLILEVENKKKVYICSPLMANTKEGIERNMYAAQAYMFYAKRYMQQDAFAPHAFLPLFFDDAIEEQRERALQYGLQYLEDCDAIFVCGNRITDGMRGEICRAFALRKTIVTFREDIFVMVKAMMQAEDKETAVLINMDHPFLGVPVTKEYIEESDYFCHDYHVNKSDINISSVT